MHVIKTSSLNTKIDTREKNYANKVIIRSKKHNMVNC